jgi:hypothetical protein
MKLKGLPASAIGLGAVVMVAALLVGAVPAVAATGPAWSIRALPQPTNFTAARNAVCEVNMDTKLCDSYTLIVTNVGDGAAETPVTISDALPTGITAVHITGEELATEESFGCSRALVRCVDGLSVAPGDRLKVTINVVVDESLVSHPAINSAQVAGGGAPGVFVNEPTTINTEPAAFGINGFAFQALDARGLADTQAGGHPHTLTTSFDLTTLEANVGNGGSNSGAYGPAEETRHALVDLPPGFVGNPQATPERCPQHDLLLAVGKTACPADSRIGTLVFEAFPGAFRASGNGDTTAVYNMQPEAGYPAVFGFSYLSKPVFMYASVVRRGSGYGLRVAVPGIPSLETIGLSLLLFGNPQQSDGVSTTGVPFFTNPADCSRASTGEATLSLDTWKDPEVLFSRSFDAYAGMTGCNRLQFQPSLAVTPDTTQADEPSGYSFDLAIPQSETEAAPGTPPLKSATVTLPAGVSVSPSAADGLAACPAEGPGAINIGSSNVTPQGQDLGDPWATELGNGQGGPGESSYGDGLWHTAPGHCPGNSTIGSVEVLTALLPKPLHGHLYLAQPGCGGEGQAPCGPADASDGNLFGMYLEVAGSGVILKLRGSVSVNPTTGQVSVRFRENPQFPFSDLRLHVDGGPRAPLANPLTCAGATTSSDLSPWSAPVTPDATPLSSFAVDWDGQGGAGGRGCPSSPPFSPGFSAGMSNTLSAGAFSPFTLTLTRGDRQQYLSQVSVTTPPGLLGMLAGVTLCGEPQAAQGTCPEASRIGTTTAAAGAGSHPLWETGRVYLTTGYRGAPFGLSIVVPADAGPFHLGNVVVRSAIHIDPSTTALTITSDPLPQIIDGVPLRIQTINVSVDRPAFMFNPTSCQSKQITATVAGAQGATVNASSPFTAAGCSRLPFAPSFTVSTQGNGSFGGGRKGHGASLDVKVSQTPGEAAIGKVDVQLPLALPARLTTLQQACTEKQFAANPAGCPAGSDVGFATATTPLLKVALTGPAYLVSHGGAAFPDLVVILQANERGGHIRIDLVGNTNIKKGITFSNFDTVPDAPISTFELRLPESTHSALAAIKNLCALSKTVTVHRHVTVHVHGHTRHVNRRVKRTIPDPLLMPTTITGQNGAVVKHNTRIAVTGCSKPKARKARGRHGGRRR